MWGDSKQSTAATTSLVYLTLGALIDVWTAVYYGYIRNHNGSETTYLIVYGFFATGIVLILIGLAVGRIGRSARPAEVAPVPLEQIVTSPSVAAAPIPAPVIVPNPPVAPPSAPAAYTVEPIVPNS